MIIVSLMGGIGNQMFQFAAGRALSLRLDTTLKLDHSWFGDMTGCTPRSYDLGAFHLQAARAETGDLRRFRKEEPRSLLGRAKARCGLSGRRIEEPYGHYWPGFESLEGDIHLVGYWQSEKYFKNVRPILLREFSVKHDLTGKNRELAELIESTHAVSLHVRRGDYVTSAETNRFHGTCGLAYYTKAIEHVVARVHDPHFFVFSDDPEWPQGNVAAPCPMTFVTHNDSSTSYEDLRLMSLCKYHVIANSSFSWWGAWLSQYPDRLVIAPERWFVDEEKNRQSGDRFPAGWVRL